MPDVAQYVDESKLGTDCELLRQYAQSREPTVFAELSRRYGGMVYATCLRITSNAHDAEELTQDCFFELARQAAAIRTSVGGWLHRLATHRALNSVRSRTRRQKHEHEAAAMDARTDPTPDVSWRDIEPLVDRAIEDLPEELRTPILLHYLENRPQTDVAAQLGVHQTTVSRRIQEGLQRLRNRLRDAGVVLAAAPLMELLTTHAGPAASPQLLSSLGKIAIAGIGSGATGNAVGGLGVSSVKLTTWGQAIGTVTVPIVVQILAGGWLGFLTAIAFLLYVAWRRPRWFVEIEYAFGGQSFRGEFFPLQRWTWTTPPLHWRRTIVQSLFAGLLLGGTAVALCFLPPGGPRVPVAAMMALYSAIPLITAARIWIRVRACNAEVEPGEFDSSERPPDTLSVVQGVCFSIVATLWVGSFALLYARTETRRDFHALSLIFMSIAAAWAYMDTVVKIRIYRRCRRDGDPAQPQIASACESSRRWDTLKVLLALLAFAGLLTFSALVHFLNSRSGSGIQTVRRMESQTAMAVCPPLALFMLTATIRVLSRLRAKLPLLVWSLASAFAVLCSVADLGLCTAWLLSGGHTKANAGTASELRPDGLLTVPVLLPSGGYARVDELAYEPGLRIYVQTPQAVRWTLYRSGTVMLEFDGRLLDVPVTEPGEYRVEARRKVHGEDRVCILSKPLRIGPVLVASGED